MRTLRAAGSAALAIGLLIGVAGCGGDDKVTVSDADGNKVAVDNDGDGVTITSEEADVAATLGTGELPANFPQDDVPIIDGEVAYAASGSGDSGKGWSVQLTSAASLDDCYAQAVEKLTDAGFEKQGEASYGETKSGSYTSGAYEVTLAGTATDGTCSMIYGVQPIG